jgi:hypothetical protein
MNVSLRDNGDGTFSFVGHVYIMGTEELVLSTFKADKDVARLAFEAFDLGRKFSG